MKKLLLSFMMVLLLAPTALKAQNEITIGEVVEGTTLSVHNAPFRNSYKSCWIQTIYSSDLINKDELTINSIAYHVASENKTCSIDKLNIYIGETTATTADNWPYMSNLTHVFYGEGVTLGDSEWEELSFNQGEKKYEYKGGNIVVLISQITSTTNNNLLWYNDPVENGSKYRGLPRSTNLYDYSPMGGQGGYGSTMNFRPHIKFGCVAAEPEVVAGDTWENPIEITELPFENTPDFTNLENDYTLPGETQDGPDAVYKFTLAEETTIAASVTGTNGKIALYAEDFNGQEGPGADNYYGATVEPGEDPVDPEDPGQPEEPEGPEGPTTFSFDFNDGTIDGWRTIDADNDGNNWQNSASIMPFYVQGPFKVNGTHAIHSATVTLSEEVLSPDNYIVTTEQYVITANSVLTWKIQPKTASGKDYYAVVVSADNENFTVVEAMYAPATTSVTECECSLASYAGQKVYIGLRHYNCVGSVDGYGPYTILVDDIVLSDGAKRSMRNSLAETTLPAGTYYLVASATEAFTVSANVVTEPESVEGDTWQNAIEIAELPFEHTPDFVNLANDYTLPGETEDGKDVVYKLTLAEETTIAATVAGANAKVALYAADFNGQEGPGADNYYGATPSGDPTVFGPYTFDTEEQFTNNFTIKDEDTENSGSYDNFMWYNYKSIETPDGNGIIISYSCHPTEYTAYDPDNYVYTTQRYKITENSVLKYKVSGQSLSYEDYYEVYISADGDNYTKIFGESIGSTSDWGIDLVDREIPLGGYANSVVHIGFRHCNSTNNFLIAIDDIQLTDGSKGGVENRADNVLESITLPAGTYYIAASATEAFTVSANVVTEPESVEGDTWQNAIEIAELPYEHTPDFVNLANDYTLPGETEDGKDAVYKLILTESTPINASVTGTNGKIAVYTETEVTTNGIGANNNIQVEEPGEDPVDPEEPEGPTTFSFDFNDGTINGWRVFEGTTTTPDDNNWANSSTMYFNTSIYEVNGTDAIFSMALGYTALYPDNYIVTTTQYEITANSVLTWKLKPMDKSGRDFYSVVVSTDNVNFTNINPAYVPKSNAVVSYECSLASYAGQKLYIGFRHYNCDGNSAYGICVDDVVLSDGSSKSSRATSTDNSIESLVLEAGTYYIAASATEEFTINIEDAYVAQVNGVKYESMQDAVNAASAYMPITLLKNVEGPAFDVEKTVTINLNGKTYTINNELPINLSEGTLTLQNGTIAGKGEYTNLINITGGAQLVHDAPISGIMTKTVAATTEGWGTISSPVGTVNHSQVEGLLVEGAELYLYDEANEYWRYFDGVNYTSLEAGRGYLYASSNATNVKFTGTFGVNDVNYTLSCASAGQLKGFNMIGNPFTHDVNVDYFSISAGASYSNQFYVLSANGGWEVGGTTIFNRNISPMKSLLIKTDKEATFTISNVKNSSKSRGEDNGMLQINVSNSQYSDAAYVSFNKGLGLDKISHRNAEIPMVYVPVDGVNYAVAMMDKDVTEVPVSFKAMTMGEYTISAKALDCEFEQMTLVDRLTGESTNLLLEDYTFLARSNDNASRFVIYLTGKDNADAESEIFVFQNNDELVINNISGNAVVRIIDIMGRPVAEYNVSGSANISTASFANGVYMIQMSDENGVKVQKVVID